MFIFSFIFILALSFFSPDSLVTMIVGGVATLGLTHWVKNQSGAMGFGAMLVALFVSVVVAVAAVVISMLLSGEGFSWDKAATSAVQVFTFATIAYKALMADNNGVTPN